MSGWRAGWGAGLGWRASRRRRPDVAGALRARGGRRAGPRRRGGAGSVLASGAGPDTPRPGDGRRAWRAIVAVALAVALLLPAVAAAQAHVAATAEGNRALAAGRAAEAVAGYRRAIALDESPAARFNLGTALAALGQSDAAIESLSLAVDGFQDPAQKALAQYNLGNVLARAGRLDDALAAYRGSLRLQASEDARFNYSLVWRWKQAEGEGPAPEEPLAPQRVQEMRDKAKALDVPVVRKPADRPPVEVDR